MAKTTNISEPGNGAAALIESGAPYRAECKINGTADLLFHRWSTEAVSAKANAAKGSAGKKTDNVESYVYRDERGQLALPGEYLRQALIAAAKFRQDPRSPRKSAMDLYRSSVLTLTPLASLGVKDWDYLDSRRVVVQRSGVTRTRPAMRSGWKASFVFLVQTPQYITPDDLQAVITQAGLLVGVGDFRPTFGRFAISSFKVLA